MADDGTALTISYNGKSTDLTIDMEQKELDYIVVSTKPTKYAYESGDAFDSTGMKVQTYYANELLTGTEKYAVIDLNDCDITSGNKNGVLTVNDNTVTVTYTLNGKSASVSFDVDVYSTGVTPKTDENGVYQIATASDLSWMAYQVGYLGNTAIDAVLTADINATSADIIPIGSKGISKTVTQTIVPAEGGTAPATDPTLTYSYNNAYAGTFDGNDKAVTLAMDTAKNYAALFGSVNGATIKDTTVKGSVSGASYVAGLVAYSTGTTAITGCVNEADVTASSSYAAGILGYTQAYATTTIDNCGNEGDITGLQYVAGIVGNCVSKVSNSYNTGDINGSTYVAGIEGRVENSQTSTIENCYNKGEVAYSDKNATEAGAGGILGGKRTLGKVTIVNCYNAGDVSYTGTLAEGATYANGALVGYTLSSNANYILSITNSYYLQEDGDTTSAIGYMKNETALTNESQPKTLAELSTMAATLGEAYQNSCGGAVLTYQTAAEHTWGDWADNTATFTEAGVETRTCTVCGATETRETVATGVATTKAAIAAIGEVTLESKSYIDVARNFYNALTEAQKAEVNNYDTLVAAEAEYAALKVAADKAAADQAAADDVEKLIAAIGDVTLDSKDAIAAAVGAFANLTAEQKALVENYDVLEKALVDYEALEAAQDADTTDKDGDKKSPSTGDMAQTISIYAVILLAACLTFVYALRRRHNAAN